MNLLLRSDLSVLHYFYSIRSIPVTYFFLAVTNLGLWEFIFGITAAACFAFLPSKRYADIAGLLTTVLGSGALILILKYTIQRPRPDLLYQAYPEGPYYSFPSGHAGLAMALYGFFIYLLLQSTPTRFRRIMIVFLPFLIFLVGFSRLYLGVHYLSDVVAGFVIGLVFVLIGIQVRLRTLTR